MAGFTIWEFPVRRFVRGRRSRTQIKSRTEDLLSRIGLGNRHPDVAFDNSFGDGVTGKTGDVVDVELAHEMLPMFVHRFEGYAEFRGDLFVGLAFGDQLEHFHFARTQSVAFGFHSASKRLLRAVLNAFGNRAAEKAVSF